MLKLLNMQLSSSKIKQLERDINANGNLNDTQKAILSTDDFIMEDELAKLLKVSTRTMYNYRKKYSLTHFKFGNRICYSKSLFIQKLNELTHR